MKIIVFLESGLVQGVVDADAVRPNEGIEYDVVDYDVFDGSSPEEIKEYFERRGDSTLEYMKQYLPEEFALFQERSKPE
jgi:hypothetical protein